MKECWSSNAKKMIEDVKAISGFGDRYAGSEADQKAAGFVREQFRKAGLEVIEEPFLTDAFEEKAAYIKSEEKTIPARAMFFSQGTPAEGIKGELVYAGIGLEKDYKNLDVKGKIVIIDRDREVEKDQFWKEVCLASEKGAIGLILVNFVDWVFITTLETGYFDFSKRLLPVQPRPIPALVLEKSDGLALLAAMKTGKKEVTLFADTFIGKRETVNIRAIKQGTSCAAEKILVYGHRDTAGTPGGNDNGSGTAILLEIARLLEKAELKRTVEIISLGAEEQLGSAGSYQYIQQHKEELKAIKASIELDMVAAGSSLCVMEGGDWPDINIRFPKWLCEYMVQTAETLGYYAEPLLCPLGTPDSGRFSEAGVPTVWLWGPGDVFYHSPRDTWDKVDPNKLKVVADIAITAICNLANQEKL